MTSLISQVISLLQQLLGKSGAGAGSGSSAANASPSTVSLMQELIAQLQGTAPATTSAAATPSPSSATAPTAAPIQNNNPGMGISSAEINAMLASANGTGPAVNFSSYDYVPPATTVAPTAGGQVSSLASQTQGQEA